MKKALLLAIMTILDLAAFGQIVYVYPNGDTLEPGVQEAIAPGYGGGGSQSGKDAYLYLPPHYDSTQATRYPVIFFYHGAGEVGSGGSALPVMLNQGLPKVIQDGHPPYSSTTPGDTTWFIVYSRQMTFMSGAYAGPVTLYDYRRLLDYYHIKMDTSRIYATGLSAGGGATSDMMMNTSGDYNYIFAAAVPMSYAGNIPTDSMVARNLGNKPMWYFHGNQDNTAYYSKSKTLVGWINDWHPGQAVLTSWDGGHCCWTTYYTPTWKWTTANSYDIGSPNNMSMYDWALQYTATNVVASNQPPRANAGTDQTLTSGTTSAVLSGSATDVEGAIASYHWSTTSSAIITSPDAQNTTVTGLHNGASYTFTLTAVDDSGAMGTDDVTITVESSSPVFTVNKIKTNFTGKDPWPVEGWNNFPGTAAGTVVNNLLDTTQTVTAISITLEDSWSGSTTTGMVTGNNSGIYPDSVIQTNLWSSSTTPLRLLVSGLDDTKNYSFHFFSSRSGSGNYTAVFSSGNVKDSIDGFNNTTLTADLDTLKSSGGSIEIDVSKGTGASLFFLNALVITEDSIMEDTPPPPPDTGKTGNIYISAGKVYIINGRILLSK